MSEIQSVSWISTCPVSGCVNKGKYYKWIHQSCGGDLKLNIEGKFICKKCNERRLFKNWKFQCGGHNPEEASNQGVAEALKSVSGIMINKKDEQFLSKVTQAIMKQFIDEDEGGEDIHEIDFVSPCGYHECINKDGMYTWPHPGSGCKGKLKLNDDAVVVCRKCYREWKLSQWMFECPNHQGAKKPSVQGLCFMLNAIGVKLGGNAGQQFLARTTKKVLEEMM